MDYFIVTKIVYICLLSEDKLFYIILNNLYLILTYELCRTEQCTVK